MSKNIYFSVFLVLVGVILVAGAVQAATTVGTNITSTGTLAVATSTITGNLTVQDAGDTTIFYVGNNNQRVGIGTTTPAYKLTIESDNATDNLFQIATSTNQNIFLVDNKGNIGVGTDPSDYYKIFINNSTSARSKTNLYSFLAATPSDTFPMYMGVESDIDIQNSLIDVYWVSPIKSKIYHSGENKIKKAAGIQSEVSLASTGNMEDIYNFYIYNELGASATPYGGVDAGNVDNLYGFYFFTYLDNNTDVGNSYGVYIDSPDVNYNDANITNNYGIYIGNQVKGLTQNYAIYTDGGDWVLDTDGGGTAGGTTGGGDIIIGEGQDLEFYHDGTNSYIINNTGNLYVSDSGTDDVILSHNGGQVGIATSTPGGTYGEKLTVVGDSYVSGTARATTITAITALVAPIDTTPNAGDSCAGTTAGAIRIDSDAVAGSRIIWCDGSNWQAN